ncbi:GtrA family protein [Streptomyces sp. TP-A0874]|uniref:GtrA family protein n=1 Tax=Streptomyces sp. TP-A0874 TaxID=549819 RepID=UPI000852EA7F|nr:GtrA family protein [Streptomyces sp. TP-A0874]
MYPTESGTKTDAKSGKAAALAREIAKFGAVGGLGIGVNFAVFNLLRSISALSVLRCSIIATVAAIVFNYLGLRYYAYRHRAGHGHAREFTLFFLFSVAGLGIENGVVYAATDWLHRYSSLETNVFKFTGVGVATLFRFWSYRTWVFTVPGARQADRRG